MPEFRVETFDGTPPVLLTIAWGDLDRAMVEDMARTDPEAAAWLDEHPE